MCASAVVDREIHRLHRRKIQASAKSVVRRQTRTTYCLRSLQKRRSVSAGRARSAPNNPAVNRLRSPRCDIEGRRRNAEPIDNVIRGSGLEVAEFSVGSKWAPIHERIGYKVGKAYLQEWSPMAEVKIDSILPILIRVA